MRSGERCQQCNVGKMHVETVRTTGSSRTRYLRCTNKPECKNRGTETVSLDDLGRPIYRDRPGDRTTVFTRTAETQ